MISALGKETRLFLFKAVRQELLDIRGLDGLEICSVNDTNWPIFGGWQGQSEV